MSAKGLHKSAGGARTRGCLLLAALSLFALLAACGLVGLGVRSGVLAPVAASQSVGPVQVVSFILCRSRALLDPCVSGRRTYEVWLVVDWEVFGTGDPRSYPLLNMALN